MPWKVERGYFRDPARRHGPYLYWSTKVKGRTVNQLLKPDEAEDEGNEQGPSGAGDEDEPEDEV